MLKPDGNPIPSKIDGTQVKDLITRLIRNARTSDGSIDRLPNIAYVMGKNTNDYNNGLKTSCYNVENDEDIVNEVGTEQYIEYLREINRGIKPEHIYSFNSQFGKIGLVKGITIGYDANDNVNKYDKKEERMINAGEDYGYGGDLSALNIHKNSRNNKK